MQKPIKNSNFFGPGLISLSIITLIITSLPQGLSLHMSPIHQFYSLQSINHVQNSSALIEMNKCMAECMQMRVYFPYAFRYHSIIYRQKYGKTKYFQGNCEVSFKPNSSYLSWPTLQEQINRNYLLNMNQSSYQQQMLIQKAYNAACEKKNLQLKTNLRLSLGLTHVYQDFLYYDNGSFTNLRPFNLTALLTAITSKLHV